MNFNLEELKKYEDELILTLMVGFVDDVEEIRSKTKNMMENFA